MNRRGVADPYVFNSAGVPEGVPGYAFARSRGTGGPVLRLSSGLKREPPRGYDPTKSRIERSGTTARRSVLSPLSEIVGGLLDILIYKCRS